MKKIIKPIIILLIIALIIGVVYFYIQKRRKDYVLEIVDSYSYYPVRVNNKYGIIDLSGNILVNPQYKQVIIPNPSKPVFACVSEDGSKKFLNDKQEELFTKYQDVSEIKFTETVSNMPYEKSVLSYKKDGKYGLIDYNGKQITKPIYEEILSVPYKEGEMLAKKDGKYGVINNKGVTLLDFKFDVIKGDGYYNKDSRYKDAGYIVGNKTADGYRYGYYNKKQEKVLDIDYIDIYRVMVKDDEENVYLIVKNKGLSGVVYNKNTIIDCKYQSIEYNSDHKTFTVKKDTKYGVFDTNGTNVIPVEYEYITYVGDYVLAEQNGQKKYFDKFGHEQLNIQFASIKATESNSYNITTTEDGMYGIMDGKQNILVNNEYAYIDYLFDNYFVAMLNNKFGIIDSNGNIIIDFQYDVLQRIDDAYVVQGKKIADKYTDIFARNLNKVATIENAIINVDNEKYIEVYSNTETKYFDLDGNEKKNTEIFTDNELFAIEQNGKWGFADRNGNIKVNCIYDKTTELNQYGFAGIKLNGRWGVVNREGNIIVEPVYSQFSENHKPDFIGKYYKVNFGYGEVYYTDEIK